MKCNNRQTILSIRAEIKQDAVQTYISHAAGLEIKWHLIFLFSSYPLSISTFRSKYKDRLLTKTFYTCVLALSFVENKSFIIDKTIKIMSTV